MVHHELMESPPSAPVSGRFTVAAAGAAVVVALAGSVIAAAYERAGTAAFADTLSFAFAIAAVAVVGAVVTLAVPGNRVGWLLLAAAAIAGAGAAFTEAGVHGVVTAPGSVPGAAPSRRHTRRQRPRLALRRRAAAAAGGDRDRNPQPRAL